MLGSLVGKHRRNRTFVYCLISVVVFTAISLLQLTNKENLDWSYYLAQFIALLVGILHIFLVFRFMPSLRAKDFWKGLGITLLIICLAVIGCAIAYYFLKLNYSFLTFVIPFIIPYVCWQTFLYFSRIPLPQYKLWYYPVGVEPPDLSGIDLSQIHVISFEFYKKIDEVRQTNFTARAPLNMPLGVLFFIFINDYNEKKPHDTIIYLIGQHHKPYGWLFYKHKGLFKRKQYFDPDLTIQENGIRQSEIIYAVRYQG